MIAYCFMSFNRCLAMSLVRNFLTNQAPYMMVVVHGRIQARFLHGILEGMARIEVWDAVYHPNGSENRTAHYLHPCLLLLGNMMNMMTKQYHRGCPKIL